MGKSTFKILFYLRKNQVNKDGTVCIMIRLSLNGEISQFSSKLNIKPDAWDTVLCKAKGNTLKARQLNETLEDIRTSLKNHYRDIEVHESFVTVEKVRNAFLGITAKQRTLLELFNHMFITDFENYLRTESKCNENTTAKFMQTFKMIVIIAKNNGWIYTDPFSNYKIRLKRVDRGYLTDAELQKIMKKKFPTKRLEQVRDVFLFSCYTGLSYVDVKELKAGDIKISFDGKPWIMIHRHKTDTPVNVPLLKIPQMLLQKYEGQLPKGQLLPVLSNQKLNSYLKEIADLCGINKNITFHLARHTFATTTTLAKGVPIETVSKMLGHTNIETTQIYARITNEKIRKDMEVLAEKLETAI